MATGDYSRSSVYIGGDWVRPKGDEVLSIISPVTEELIGTAPAPGFAEADAAVESAKASFDSGVWRNLPVADRMAKVGELADQYEAIVTEMGQTITAEMGGVITWTTNGQARGSVTIMRRFIEEAAVYPWEEPRLDGYAHVIREPGGVVVAIPPWNVPQSVTMTKLIPALLAGCSVVVKPSPETPLDALLLADAVHAAGFPPGVVNIIPAGREVGERLVAHPDVDHVAFTGSTASGRHIAGVCGQSLKRATLELGGKSAAIICDDADLAVTMEGLKVRSFGLSGQGCITQSRILAPRSQYDEIVEALANMVSTIKVGDPTDESTQMGPLVSEAHRRRVLGYIELGEEEGAKVAAGGTTPPAGLERGWYVPPTVFAGVQNDMRIAREEIFGPVICVIPYEDDAEAIAIANDSEYGLSGSVWTKDEDRGESIARQVRTGMTGVNMFMPDYSMPFGGYKDSGIGREFGREGIDAFVELKAFYHHGRQGLS